MAAHLSSSHQSCSAGRVIVRLLLSFLALPSPTAALWSKSGTSAANQVPLNPLGSSSNLHLLDSFAPEHDFELRHIFHHGTYAHPYLHRRLDIKATHPTLVKTEDEQNVRRNHPLRARTKASLIQRMSDRRMSSIESLMQEARLTGAASTLSFSAWTMDELYGPNITDKETVLNLARMAADAYILLPGTEDWEWQNISTGFNYSNSFGWESDGLRGHIFADKTNSTIVIALKGTSLAVYTGDGTSTNDKENDNLLFSCCCGQGGQYTWRSVCDCYSSTYTCNNTCLVQASKQENRYYRAALNLYGNVTELYPQSDVWVTGHSLGGSVGSLLGMTFGLPVVTFEAPPEALAFRRLRIP